MKSRTGTSVLAALLALTGTGLAADYTSWAKVRPVTLNTSAMTLSGPVYNIPLLVRFNSTDHADMFTGGSAMAANGADIRVTKADGTTDVAFEIETATSTSLALWIKADTVPTSGSKSFRVYWGKTGQTTLSNSKAVFDTANGFVAVWHMNSLNDATHNGHTLVASTSAPTAVADSLIGEGRLFTAASTQFFNIQGPGNTTPSGATLNLDVNNGPYTITAWAKPTSCPSARMTVIGKYDGAAANNSGTRQWALQTKNTAANWGMSNDPTGGNFATGTTANEFVADAPGSCVAGSSVYMAGSYFSSTAVDTGSAAGHASKLRFQVNNGAPVTSGYGNIGVGQAGTNSLPFIGKMAGTSPRYMDGILDEITVSKVQRDTNWVEVSYETQKKSPTAVTIGASGTPGVTSPYAAWTGTRDIILNTSATGAKVTANVTNFPVLVRLGSNETNILTAAKSDGADIRFAKEGGITPLKYQIESWSPTSAAVWVKVDTILGNNATQKIVMYWGKSDATSESAPAQVFDTAQYLAVWHMNDATNQVDATGRGNVANASTPAPTALPGSLIGAGKTFNGSTNWYQVGANATALDLNTNLGPYSLSAWVRPASCDARIAAISKYSNSNDIAGRQYALHTANTTTTWRFTNGAPALTGAGDAEFVADAAEACVAGNWSYIVGTYRSAGTPTADSAINAKIYVNGALAASGTTSSITGTSLGNLSNTFIGRIATDERYMNGDLDEIRVSKVARDSNWVRLNYENQKFVNTLVNIGNPTLSAPGAPTGVTATPGAKNSASITVNWVAPASNGNSPITSYKAMAVGDTTKMCTSTGLSCVVTGLTAGAPYTFTVKATNAIGTSAASTASTSVNAPVPIAGPGTLLLNVGHFARNYTFVLPAEAAAITEEMTMTISDVYGRNVWSKTISPSESKVGQLTWNGFSANGHKVGMGVYIVRVKTLAEGKAKQVAQMGVKLAH